MRSKLHSHWTERAGEIEERVCVVVSCFGYGGGEISCTCLGLATGKFQLNCHLHRKMSFGLCSFYSLIPSCSGLSFSFFFSSLSLSPKHTYTDNEHKTVERVWPRSYGKNNVREKERHVQRCHALLITTCSLSTSQFLERWSAFMRMHPISFHDIRGGLKGQVASLY